MKVVVGLGNPGERYKKDRHNVGFMVVDELVRVVGGDDWKRVEKFKAEAVREGEVFLIKPQTFMNNSGESVSSIVNFYKVEMDDLWVVHDDLDVELGEYKIQKGVGPKVHNGVNDIEEKLGKRDFWRVRIGVDNRDGKKVPGDEYVLGKFTKEERSLLFGVIEKVVEEIRDRLY